MAEIIAIDFRILSLRVSGRFASEIHFKYSRRCDAVHVWKKSLKPAARKASAKSFGMPVIHTSFSTSNFEDYHTVDGSVSTPAARHESGVCTPTP